MLFDHLLHMKAAAAKLSKKVTAEMLKEAFRVVGETDHTLKNSGDLPPNSVVRTQLQLWGAGVPINRWVAEDGSGFL